MSTGHWVVRIHALPYHMFYTGMHQIPGEPTRHSAWSFDPARAHRFATEADADREARTLARWLNSEHRAVVQLPGATP
jgi:hypothetical protein